MDGRLYIQATSSHMNEAADSADQGCLLHIKEWPEDEDVEIGPTVLQYVDSYYGSIKLDMIAVRQEKAIREESIIKYNKGGPLPHNSGEAIEVKQTVTHHQLGTPVTQPAETVLNRCHQCMKIFKSKGCLMVHYKNIHGTESYKCIKCNTNYKCKAYLQSHVRKIHSGKTYECMDCRKVFKSKSSMLKHRPIHKARGSTDSNPSHYICDYCQKVFKKRDLIQMHISAHVSGTYNCSDCDKYFICERLLFTHIRQTHIANAPKQACNVCGKILTRMHLKRHVIYKHNGKRYQCKFCGKTVKWKQCLSKHLKVNCQHFTGMNSRPFACDHCERSYRSKPLIRAHIRRYHKSLTHPVKISEKLANM